MRKSTPLWFMEREGTTFETRSKASCRSANTRAIVPAARPDWLNVKTSDAPAVKREAEEDWGRGRWR